MNELFEIPGSSIFTFKPGDLLYRTKRMVSKTEVYNENLMISIEVTSYIDNSYRKCPLEFICVKNNNIYLREIKADFTGKRRVKVLLLELWSEDWALFEIPEGLTLEECLTDY